MRRAIYSLILLALLGAQTVTAGGPEPKRTPFGVVEAYYRPDDARDLAVGWERIIFEWAQIQPGGPDDYDTGIVPEAWLADAQQSGREVVGLLKNTPLWASGSDKLGAPPTGLDLPIDDPDNYWAAFVQRTVRTYGEQWGIHHWIIYNEPDIRPGDLPWYEFDGDVQDYFHMLKVAYLAAHAVDPAVQIHMAGMAWYVDVSARRDPYLKRLLEVISDDPDARANGFYFDGLMVHTYFGTQNIWEMIQDTRQILRFYGLYEKPIWVDETNARPSSDPYAVLPPGAFEVSLGQQADYIVQAAALCLAAGVERVAVYRLYDNHYTPGLTEPWGLVRGDGSHRPAFEAYRMVIEMFSATRQARRIASEHATVIELEQADRTLYVMWARDTEPVRFYVLASGDTATAISVYGAASPVQAQTVAGVDGTWFAVDAPGAVADANGLVMVEGSPLILAVDGPPRPAWVDDQENWWTLN